MAQYIVKKGDNLSTIAKRNGVKLSDILKLNKIENPDYIQIGQKINLSDRGENKIMLKNTSSKLYSEFLADQLKVNNTWKGAVVPNTGKTATIGNFNKSTPIPVKAQLKNPKSEEEDSSIFDDIKNTVSKYSQMASTTYNRKIKPLFEDKYDDDNSTTKMNLQTPKKVVTYDNITGNPIKDPEMGADIYHRSRYIDLDNPEIKTGIHNRGTKIKGDQPFKQILFSNFDNKKFESINPTNIKDDSFYIGQDDTGKIIMGNGKDLKSKKGSISEFSILKDITGFSKVNNNIETAKSKDAKKANNPYLVNDKNEKVPLNILSSTDDNGNDKYGQWYGGSLIVTSPDMKKKVLISGSLNEVNQGLEKFKKDNNLSKVHVVKVDNGSYSRQFASQNPKGVNQEFWSKYEGLNTSGGNNLYEYEFGGLVDKYPLGGKVTSNGIDLSNTYGDRKVFSLDEFKNIVPDYIFKGYLDSGNEGLYKNINKANYPVQVDTLPDGSITYRPYSYESAETSFEDYKKLSQNNQPIKSTPIQGFKSGGIVQSWIQKFVNGGIAEQQNYLDLNRINNENMEKANQSSGSGGGGMMGGSGMMGGGGMDMFSGMFKAIKQSINNKRLEGRNKKQKEVNLHNATINPYINSYQQFDDPNQLSQSNNQIETSTPEMTWDNEEGNNTATKSKFDKFTMQMGKPGTAGAMLDQIGDMAYASSQQGKQMMQGMQSMMGGQGGGGGQMDMSQFASMFGGKRYGGYIANGGYNASYMDFMNTNTYGQPLKGISPNYLSSSQINTDKISSQNYLNNVTPMEGIGTQKMTTTPNQNPMADIKPKDTAGGMKGAGLTSSVGGIFSKIDQGVQSLYDGVGAMTDADSGAGAWFQGGAKAGQIAGKYTEGLKNIPVYGEIIAAAIDSVARFTGGALNVRDRQEYNKMKDRQDKVDEYKSRQAPLVYDPNKKGQYMAKYGANPKMMEQRIIDDIYSDFDKYMKKV